MNAGNIKGYVEYVLRLANSVECLGIRDGPIYH